MRLNARLRLHSRRYRKRLQVESLETRRLLAADPWTTDGQSALLAWIETPQTPEEAQAIDETSSGSSAAASTAGSAAAPLAQTFLLHSNPTATKTIYLDFDGHEATGTIWNSGSRPDPIVTPKFSLDSDVDNFSDTELTRIQAIWEWVAEDFLPFDVDVTTEDPGSEALRKYGVGDEEWGARAAIGGSWSDWYNNSAGGVAYIGSFQWSTDTPVYVFENNLGNGNEKYTAEAISHEVGHSLGLYHDGNSSTTYYQGHGSGDTGWAPIMGNGYYRQLTQWSKGEYPNADETQDDLAIITGNYGFGYRVDDHSDALAGATALVVDPSEDWGEGIIEQTTDVDYFVFTTDGTVDIQIEPFYRSPNLDIGATLYDSTGTLVATSNPTDLLSAEIQLSVTAGTYYLAIDGVGKPPLTTGYSDYASLGYYSISGTAECHPVGMDDSYSTDEDETLNVAAPGVLGNDTASKGGALTASLESNATHGSVTLNSNGSFQYTPDADYSGADSFVYRVHESGAGSRTATVNLTVNPVNDSPVADDDSYSTNEDTALNIAASGVLANDDDADGQTLTAVFVSGPSNGSLTLNANGSFEYTPDAHFHGVDSFTYRANDGTVNSNVATVEITVNPLNDTPVAENDDYSTNEDTNLNVSSPSVLDNDSDADGNGLTAVLVGDVSHGTLTLNANGSFQYIPDADFHGADSFSYRANDGTTNSGLATVQITVNSVNDAPTAAGDSYTATQDSLLNISASGVLGNDDDVEGDTLTAVLITDVSHGALTLNANGSFTYTPDAGYTGADSFTYRASDSALESSDTTANLNVVGPVDHFYDFGTSTSPLANGHERVSSQTQFTSQLGHGWVSGTVYEVDRATGSDLDRDLNYTTDGTFEVAVANGTYSVSVGLGDLGPFAHDTMALSFEGTQVDTVSTNAGQVMVRNHSVTVSDGRLTMRLQDLGGDPFTVITSLTLVPVPPDTTSPTVTINQAAGQADPSGNPVVYFDVEFDESVSGFTAGDVDLTGGTAPGTLQAEITGSGSSYVVAVSGMTDSGTVVAQITASAADDAAGNSSLASTSTDNSVTYNHQPGFRFDFGSSTSPLANGFMRVSSQTLFTSQLGHGWVSGVVHNIDRATGSDLDRDLVYTSDGTFEATVANGTYDVEVGLGDLGPFAHDAMAVSFEGTQVDTVNTNAAQVVVRSHSVTVADGRLTLRLRDLGGDPFTVITSLTVMPATPDTTSPTVTINQAAGQTDPTNNPIIYFDVEFDESVTGFNATDVNLAGGTAPGTLQAEVTGSGSTYVVAVSGMSGSGTVVAQITAGAADDAAGNSSLVSTSTDNSVAYNYQPGFRFDFGTSTSALASGFARVSSQTLFTSQLGHGWVSGTIREVDRSTGSDLDRDLNYTSNGTFELVVANGTYDVEVGLGDLGPYAHDAMAVYFEGTQVDTVNTNAAQVLVRNHSVTVADGRLTLRLHDLGGDPFTVITSLTVVPATPDTTAPTVTINQAAGQADPTTNPVIYFAVEFDESVSGFAAGDVDLSGSTAAGTLQAEVTGSGSSYVVAVSGMTDSGNVVAQIASGAASDLAGNTSQASTSTDNSVTYSHQPGFHFDFGTSTSPLSSGFQRVSSQTLFTSQLGHGWVGGTIRDVDRSAGSDLDCDLIYTADGTFEVAVANGTYDIELRLGDMGPYQHDAMWVYFEGMPVDILLTNPGQVVARNHTVTVADGRLTLRLRDMGGDPFTVITAMTVLPAGAAQPLDAPLSNLNLAPLAKSLIGESNGDANVSEAAHAKGPVLAAVDLTPGSFAHHAREVDQVVATWSNSDHRVDVAELQMDSVFRDLASLLALGR